MNKEYFVFNGVSSKDLNMFIINDSSGYSISQYLPQVQDNFEVTNKIIVDRGRHYGERIISFQVAVETKEPLRVLKEISRWLEVDTLRPLIFSRESYKQYYARRTGELTPKIYSNYMLIPLQFICLDYLAYSVFSVNEIDEFIMFDENFKHSGIKYNAKYTYENPSLDKQFSIYHGGNCDKCKPKITIKGTFDDLIIRNVTTGEECVLNYSLNNDEMVIDCANQAVFVNGSYSVVGHSGAFISLKGKSELFGDIISDNDEDGYNKIEFVTANPYEIKEIRFDFRFVYY